VHDDELMALPVQFGNLGDDGMLGIGVDEGVAAYFQEGGLLGQWAGWY